MSEPVEGSPPWCSAVLDSVGQIADWIDAASPVLEPRIAAQLERIAGWLERVRGSLGACPELEPLYLLELARLAAFRGDSQGALEQLTQFLHHPGAGADLSWLEKARRLLRDLFESDYDASRLDRLPSRAALRDWERILRTLLELPPILASGSSAEMRHECISFLVRLVRPHQAFWLQKVEGRWRPLVYQGPPGFAFFSQEAVDRSIPEGCLQLPARPAAPSDSVVLSEARTIFIQHLPYLEAALYLSHREPFTEYDPAERELLTLVARLIGTHLHVQETHAMRLEVERQALQEREMLAHVYDQAGLGIVWLSPELRPVSWNQAFARAHPLLVSPGDRDRPLWQAFLAADQARGRAFLESGRGSETLRCQASEDLTWQHYQIERTLDGGLLGVVRDVSAERWEEAILFLEQERHWRACDLHDGPAQVAALSLLTHPAPITRAQMETVTETLDLLSSPLFTRTAPATAFLRLGEALAPEAQWEVDCPLADWSPRALVLYRVLQDWFTQLADVPYGERLRLTVSGHAEALEARVQPLDASLRLSPASLARLALVQGSWGRATDTYWLRV